MVWTTFSQDHGAIAQANLPLQFGRNKPLIRALVNAFAGELNPIEATLGDLFTLRWLDNATGVQLDLIGNIVGQSRAVASSVYISFFGFSAQAAAVGFGQARIRHDGEVYATTTELPDTEYRALLYAKIAQNNSHGTVEDIITTMLAVFNVTKVIVQNVGVATIAVYIGRYLAPAEAIREIAYSLIPSLAGVGFTVNQYNPNAIFGFANQGYLGFGQGELASDIRNVIV